MAKQAMAMTADTIFLLSGQPFVISKKLKVRHASPHSHVIVCDKELIETPSGGVIVNVIELPTTIDEVLKVPVLPAGS